MLPSEFMTKISSSPARSVANAILVPSGDQSGPKSKAERLVRFVCSVPSACMTKTSGWEPRRPNVTNLVKAIRVSSGDHAGPPSSAGSFEMFVCPLPSAFMRKTS